MHIELRYFQGPLPGTTFYERPSNIGRTAHVIEKYYAIKKAKIEREKCKEAKRERDKDAQEFKNCERCGKLLSVDRR